MSGAVNAVASAVMEWAGPTLLAVTGLLVLVLLIRRPVARWLGPKAVYALWSLPLVRLLLLPVTLSGVTLPTIEADRGD